MEKEGLVRCVKSTKSAGGLRVHTIIMDRHPQIIKYVREEMPNTLHMFDVWHVAKGTSKVSYRCTVCKYARNNLLFNI